MYRLISMFKKSMMCCNLQFCILYLRFCEWKIVTAYSRHLLGLNNVLEVMREVLINSLLCLSATRRGMYAFYANSFWNLCHSLRVPLYILDIKILEADAKIMDALKLVRELVSLDGFLLNQDAFCSNITLYRMIYIRSAFVCSILLYGS